MKTPVSAFSDNLHAYYFIAFPPRVLLLLAIIGEYIGADNDTKDHISVHRTMVMVVGFSCI